MSGDMRAEPTRRTLRATAMAARRAAAAQAHRRLRCHFCGSLMQLCVPCDRGQRYCGALCRDQGRRRQVRQAGQRYQQTEAGRLLHAARQRAYAARRKAGQLAAVDSPATVAARSQQAVLCPTTVSGSARRKPQPLHRVTHPLQSPACCRCGRSGDGWIRRSRGPEPRRRRTTRGP